MALTRYLLTITALTSLLAFGGSTPPEFPIAEGPFEPTAESLRQFECPEWLRSIKLGFWSHWGPQAQPAQGDWYARGMYIPGPKGRGHYEFHVRNYGHPSRFGFKDIVERWKAEKFTAAYADYLMRLYKRAGAGFFVSMAHHHDNFDMWDSRYHSWDAVEKGPHKNIVAIWEKAARSNGLRFGVSSHVHSSPEWWKDSHGADKTGPQAGVPYDGADPRFAELYHPRDWESEEYNWPLRWYRRVKDLVDQHRPDILYFDGGIPFFDTHGKRLVAHYYNQNAAGHQGRLEGLVLSKRREQQEMAVWDLEFSVVLDLLPEPWVSDTFIGHWFWNSDYEDGDIPFGSPDFLVDYLVDVVSKNGTLMMAVPQRGDGTVSGAVIESLEELAQWVQVHGEGIFNTRPWEVYGEGPSIVRHGVEEDARREGKVRASLYNLRGFNDQHIRFTRSKDGAALYAFVLGWPHPYELGFPQDNVLTIRSIRVDQAGPDARIELLGYENEITWDVTSEKRLAIDMPDLAPQERPSPYAIAFKITGFDLAVHPER